MGTLTDPTLACIQWNITHICMRARAANYQLGPRCKIRMSINGTYLGICHTLGYPSCHNFPRDACHVVRIVLKSTQNHKANYSCGYLFFRLESMVVSCKDKASRNMMTLISSGMQNLYCMFTDSRCMVENMPLGAREYKTRIPVLGTVRRYPLMLMLTCSLHAHSQLDPRCSAGPVAPELFACMIIVIPSICRETIWYRLSGKWRRRNCHERCMYYLYIAANNAPTIKSWQIVCSSSSLIWTQKKNANSTQKGLIVSHKRDNPIGAWVQ